MNNNMPMLPNIHQLTQQIIDSSLESSEVDVLKLIPTKSLQEMNDACLADIHETSPIHRDVTKTSSNRPAKRRKSSSGSRSSSSSSTDLNIKIKGNYYDEGLNVFTDPIHISDLLNLNSSRSTAALLYNLGLANLQRDQEDTALHLFRLALDMCKKDGGLDYISGSVGEITILHNIGCIYYHQQEYDQALDTFTRLEVLSLVKHGSHHLTVASALNCIGVVLFHNTNEHNSQNVLDNLFESLSIRKGILGPEHKDVATTLNNIGRVYFDISDYAKAIVYYQESLLLRRKVLGPHHMDVSATAFNAGQTCQKLGDLDKSLQLYQEYFEITSKKLGDHHQGTITVLKHIGQVYQELDEVKEAHQHYQDALKSSRKVFGRFNREVASILNLLGNLHYENGDFDEAIAFYEEGLSIERAVLHQHCNNIVVTLSNIGQALMQKGEYQSALSKYNEVHFIQAQQNTKKIPETLSIIGQINTLLGKYAQAEKAFLKVISMTNDACNDKDIDVALALNYLGLVYFKKGDLNSAMEKFQESLRVRMCAPRTSSDVAVLLYNIASIYLHKGDNESALNHYKHALKEERRALGHDHPDVGITLKLIGKVYDRCGQYDDALQHYSEALQIYENCYGPDATPSMAHSSGCSSGCKCGDARDHKKSAARILALIAGVHLRQANTQKMTASLSQAYRLFQDIGAPVQELELDTGFDLYELSILHPECAAAA